MLSMLFPRGCGANVGGVGVVQQGYHEDLIFQNISLIIARFKIAHKCIEKFAPS